MHMTVSAASSPHNLSHSRFLYFFIEPFLCARLAGAPIVVSGPLSPGIGLATRRHSCALQLEPFGGVVLLAVHSSWVTVLHPLCTLLSHCHGGGSCPGVVFISYIFVVPRERNIPPRGRPRTSSPRQNFRCRSKIPKQGSHCWRTVTGTCTTRNDSVPHSSHSPSFPRGFACPFCNHFLFRSNFHSMG